MITLLMLGCDQPQITRLHGTVYSSHDPQSRGLAAARLSVVDEDGNALADAVTDADGRFSVEVASGESVFVVITAQGYATSTFPGNVGISPDFEIEDHALFGVSLDELDGVRIRWTGCPGVGEGATVFGEIREYGIVDPNTGQSPTTNAGTASVAHGKNSVWPGCYLDEDGIAYDPAADFTGATGRFAVFGVEPGLSDLVVQTKVADASWTEDEYPVYVPDGDDVVSAWYPAFASFPGL